MKLDKAYGPSPSACATVWGVVKFLRRGESRQAMKSELEARSELAHRETQAEP